MDFPDFSSEKTVIILRPDGFSITGAFRGSDEGRIELTDRQKEIFKEMEDNNPLRDLDKFCKPL